jgi:hypothetical protein
MDDHPVVGGKAAGAAETVIYRVAMDQLMLLMLGTTEHRPDTVLLTLTCIGFEGV